MAAQQHRKPPDWPPASRGDHHRRLAHAGPRLGRAAGGSTWKGDWQFSGSQGLDQAYVKYFGAFGAAWDGAMVVRWSADPLGMLWPEMDTAFVTSIDGNGGTPAAARRPVVIVAAG